MVALPLRFDERKKLGLDSAKMRFLSPLVFFGVGSRSLSLYIYILEELPPFCALKHQKQRSMDASPALTHSALNCYFLGIFRRQTKLNGFSCCPSSNTSKRILSASGLCFGSLAGSSGIVPKFADRFRQFLDLSTLISLISPQHIIIPTYLARLL